jgi:hypothetical protein
MKSIEEQINEQLMNIQNPRDSAFRDMAKYLWDRDKLKQLTELNSSQVVDVVRNLIIIYTYESTWKNLRIDYEIKALKTPPFYIISSKETNADVTPKEMKESTHYILLHDILELFISLKRKGREENFSFLKDLDRSLAIKEQQNVNAKQQL